MKIGVIGSGAMGSGIAQVAANAECQVLVYDTNQMVLDKAKNQLVSTFEKLVQKQKLTDSAAKEIIHRIEFVSDLTVFSDCQLIIEAVVEDLAVKQKLFSELENMVGNDCILASNTSSLSIASIASACKNPSRVIGIHFFNPAPLMPLVEIIPAITTSDDIAEKSFKIIQAWRKVAVSAKDTPGFIVNRVARSYYGESIRIYEEGIADFSTIDWALKEFGGFKMGPFELMDFIGNDINYKVTESVWQQFFYEARFKPSLTQKRLFESKLYGRKSGRGYYNYAEGVQAIEPTKDEVLGKEIFLRVISMLINEAIDSFYLKLASKEDIDLAMTKGVNYPKGLLLWADEIGQESILNKLNELCEIYQEERYRPSVLLKNMVAQNQKFYV